MKYNRLIRAFSLLLVLALLLSCMPHTLLWEASALASEGDEPAVNENSVSSADTLESQPAQDGTENTEEPAQDELVELSAIAIVQNYDAYVSDWRAALGLPTAVTVKLTDGTTAKVDVTWDYSGLDLEKTGRYFLTGKLDADGREELEGLTARQLVVVREKQNLAYNGSFSEKTSSTAAPGWYFAWTRSVMGNPEKLGDYLVRFTRSSAIDGSQVIVSDVQQGIPLLSEGINAAGAGQYYMQFDAKSVAYTTESTQVPARTDISLWPIMMYNPDAEATSGFKTLMRGQTVTLTPEQWTTIGCRFDVNTLQPQYRLDIKATVDTAPPYFYMDNIEVFALRVTLPQVCTHDYSIRVLTAPDCTTAGMGVYTCTICLESHTGEIPPLGHRYDAVVKEPTCAESGYATYTCDCGDSYGETLAPLSHSYKGITCTVCGAIHPNAASYEGKVISVLGDSISAFKGYVPVADGFNEEHPYMYPIRDIQTWEQMWWGRIIDSLDAKLGINDSWFGSCVQNTNTEENPGGYVGTKVCMPSLTRVSNLGTNGTPDVILVYAGTNDGQFSTFGGFDPTRDYSQVDLDAVTWETFEEAYAAMIMRLQYYYPDARIIALTPTYAALWYTNETLAIMNESIRQICEYFAVDCVDLRECGITMVNIPDGLHPDVRGMAYIANAVLETLMDAPAPETGENVVHTVTQVLDGVKASNSHYKGVSEGKSFEEILTGESLCVQVTMGGVDITADCYENGKLCIEKVTGDIVITAKKHTCSGVATEPTCGEKGYTTYTCQCGFSYVDDYVPATGDHEFFDGFCINCGAEGPQKAEDLKFLQAPSLSFQDYIGMQVLISSSLRGNYDEIYVEAVQLDPEKGAVTTRLEGLLYFYDLYLVFDQQILSWSMAEEVSLTLYGVKDGRIYIGQTVTQSVESLALAMLSAHQESNPKLCAVLVDMLNYGAAVQITYNHNATMLPNTKIAEFSHLGTAQDPEMTAEVTKEGTGPVAILQTSISMQSKVEIQLLLAADISAYTPNAAIGEKQLSATVDTETMSMYGYTIIRVAVAAADMRENITIALYDGEGSPVTAVYTISAEAFAKYLANGAQGAVALAMMRYGDSVAAYAGK